MTKNLDDNIDKKKMNFKSDNEYTINISRDNINMPSVRLDCISSTWKILINNFREFCEQTNIHGFNHVGKTKYNIFERLFWLIAIILAVFGIIEISLGQWQRYNDNPTVVTLQKDFRKWNYSFPAITACLEDKVDKIKAKSLIQRLWNITPTDEKFNYYMQFLNIVGNVKLHDLKLFERNVSASSLNIDFYGIAIEIYREFPGKNTWSNENDDSPKWKPIMTETGVCFTINSLVIKDIEIKKVKEIESPTPLIECRYTDNLCYVRIELAELCCTYSIHSAYDTMSSGDSALRTCRGTDSELVLRVLETRANAELRALQPVHRRCRFSDEPLFSNKQVYSSEGCVRSCRNKLAIHMCGCKPFYNFMEDGPYCTLEGLICLSNYVKELKTLPKAYIKCDCPQQCVDSVFQVISVRESTLAGVFAQRSSVRYTLQSPRTRYSREILFYFEDLIVSFGGATGLFLGCSFLSFIEIIYFVFEKIFYAVHCIQHRKKYKTNTNNFDYNRHRFKQLDYYLEKYK